VDWMGSHVFLETPGYYSRCTNLDECGLYFNAMPRNARQRADWTYEWRDAEGRATADWGKPFCGEWWADSERGLKKKLVAYAEGEGFDFSVFDSARNLRLFGGIPRAVKEDVVVKKLLDRDPPAMAPTPNAGLDNIGHLLVSVLATGGTAVFKVLYDAGMTLVIEALPMVQALTLFAVYYSLPFGLLVSGFSVRSVVNYAWIIFGLQFLTAIWATCRWLGDALTTEWFAGKGSHSATAIVEGVTLTHDMLLAMLIMGFYIMFPGLWFWIVNEGRKVSSAAVGQFMEGATKSAERAGQEGGKAGVNAAGKIGNG